MNNNVNATDIARRLAEGATAWRRGDDDKALDWLQQGCLLWLDELENDRLHASAAVAELAPLVDALVDTLEHGDVALAADMLEFKLTPLLRSLYDGGEQAD